MSTLRVASDSFAEFDDLNAILDAGRAWFVRRTVGEVRTGAHCFPIVTATLGSADPEAPAIGFFGGVHGLERIGTQLILDYMRALLRRLEWDDLLSEQLRAIRLVFMPIVNPGGMWARTRSNPNGVDLMRNAPQSAEGRVPFLAGGQRIGPLAAVVSRQRRRVDGSGERGAAVGGRGGADLAAAQLRARLPFRLRLGRQHLVSLRAHRSARCRISPRCSC